MRGAISSDWADEAASDAPRDARVVLDESGVTYDDGDTRVRATWAQVFGVAIAKERAYILMPRRPPSPPWVEVRKADLPQGVEDLDSLATRVRARVQQTGYRSGGPRRPLLPPSEFMAQVLQRVEVPGALEIPVGPGPSGWTRRVVDVATSGTAGGLAGLWAGTVIGAALTPVAIIGLAVVGAAAPVFFSDSWRPVRKPGRKPRVMVLAPDGCIVGLPSGPRSFSWDEVGSFTQTRSASRRAELTLTLADGTLAGSIDGAWFGAPLELIVAVAGAYHERHRKAAR